MRTDDLNFLKHLDRLKRIKAEADNAINTTDLERDFLRFSAATKHSLFIKNPKVYRMGKDEQAHYISALDSIGKKPSCDKSEIRSIGISGDFDGKMHDGVIFISTRQFAADHLSGINSYLNPLIETAITECAGLIRDFSIHEAICSKVKILRGSLDVSEAHLFPDRFEPGAYSLEMLLDTPSHSVHDLIQLRNRLDDLEASPFPKILDKKLVDELATGAKTLRSKIGALGRYNTPKTQKITVPSNTTYLNFKNTELFYLYNPDNMTNAVVYFGEDIFHSKYKPKGLKILPGSDHQFTLSELTAAGFFTPSDAVLNQRLIELKEAYDDAVRKHGSAIDQSSSFGALISELETAKNYLSEVRNPDMRSAYFAKKSPEILEFAVVPKDNNPILHHILPRLSWNQTLRDYQDTNLMIEKLSSAKDDELTSILQNISSRIFFRNQQNYELNAYIAENYATQCQRAGIDISQIR